MTHLLWNRMECCDFKISVCCILISAEFCCWSYVVKGLPLLPCTYFSFVTLRYFQLWSAWFYSYPLHWKYLKALIFFIWLIFCEWCFLNNYCALSLFRFRRTFSDYLFFTLILSKISLSSTFDFAFIAHLIKMGYQIRYLC